MQMMLNVSTETIFLKFAGPDLQASDPMQADGKVPGM